MIVLIGASAMFLTALQASINAPRDAFRVCIKEATSKASAEKVGPDAIEAYLRANCSAPMGSLKAALMAFGIKNGMGKKTATSDAEMTVDDYLASPVDKYKFMSTMNAPKTDAAASTPPKPSVRAQRRSRRESRPITAGRLG